MKFEGTVKIQEVMKAHILTMNSLKQRVAEAENAVKEAKVEYEKRVKQYVSSAQLPDHQALDKLSESIKDAEINLKRRQLDLQIAEETPIAVDKQEYLSWFEKYRLEEQAKLEAKAKKLKKLKEEYLALANECKSIIWDFHREGDLLSFTLEEAGQGKGGFHALHVGVIDGCYIKRWDIEALRPLS
jgi:hypothetical protein